jgi:hypothetical protein
MVVEVMERPRRKRLSRESRCEIVARIAAADHRGRRRRSLRGFKIPVPLKLRRGGIRG